MEGTINRSCLKVTAFVLSYFLNVMLFAQDKELDEFYHSQQLSTATINFQRIDLKTQAITLPDTFLPRQSNVPLLRNENAGIGKKIGRAELLIGGAELVGITALILTPKEVTGWSPDWTQDAWNNMRHSLSMLPVWDKDDWQINYVGHPIAGSLYYNSLRSQNSNIFHSFLFATAQSFIWEYIIEATAEKPSTQDLIITPIVGSLLGESVHRVTMNMRRNGFNFFEKVFVIISNPMFAINNGFGPRFNPVKQKQLF